VAEYNQDLVSRGQEPFYAVYPKDALAISDAPLGFRPHNNQLDAGKRRIVTELQDYLLNDPEAQAKLLQLGRRPAAKSFGLNLTGADPAVFNADWGLQPIVTGQEVKSPSAAVIEAALDRYQTAFRRPAQAWFCLDGSGSMNGNNGWVGIKAAGHQLFDVEQAKANFLLTHPEDRTTVAIFNQGMAGGPWTVEGNDPAQLHGLAERIDEYRVDGGTDMYACLQRACRSSQSPSARTPTGRNWSRSQRTRRARSSSSPTWLRPCSRPRAGDKRDESQACSLVRADRGDCGVRRRFPGAGAGPAYPGYRHAGLWRHVLRRLLDDGQPIRCAGRIQSAQRGD
jgi:hypothetical protein